MDEAIARYIYSKVVDDLRSRRQLPPDTGAVLDVYPHIDRLRAVVEESDVPVLLDGAAGEWTETVALAVSLLRGYATRPDVRDALRNLWRKHTAFGCRYELSFRLLDDPDLPLEWHREIHRFAQEHSDKFLEASVVRAGGMKDVLDRVATRLADASFPRSKAWVYLFIATASNEYASVVELLKVYAAGKDFTAAVATELLESLDNSRPHAMVH